MKSQHDSIIEITAWAQEQLPEITVCEEWDEGEWDNVLPKGPAADLLSSEMLKEEGTLHSGKHEPVPTFSEIVAAIKF